MSIAEKEDVVFRFLCYYSSLPSLYETIFSVRKLAEHFCTSVYHMRKIVNTLVQKELLVLTYVGGQDDDGNVRCYKGYSITVKATKTNIYKEESQKVMEYLNDFLKPHNYI